MLEPLACGWGPLQELGLWASVGSGVYALGGEGIAMHGVSWLGLVLLVGQAIGQAQPLRQGPGAAAGEVTVRVNLAKVQGEFQPIYNWFGYDEANYTTTVHGRELLRELHDLTPVPVYVRTHNLLTSGDGTAELKWGSTGVYREDAAGKPIYDFKLLDGIFDAYQAAGVRPMLELGFMPEDLAANVPGRTQPYQVHFPASTVSGRSNNPPKDFGKWQELVRVVVAHLVVRYGAETVRQWYFEVWNEPDIEYWHVSAEQYWKLYDFSVAGVRAALPGARVGGPATTGPGGEKGRKFLQVFLEHVLEGKSAADGGRVPLDFVSFHAKGSPTINGGVVTMGLNRELNDADVGFKMVASFAKFKRLPIILSEADPEGCAACSSKVNPANNYRNGTVYPAYTAAATKALGELARRDGVNLVSMLSWSFEFEGKDYFEGFRSLATNGVDKPVLNVFRMMGLMAGKRVEVVSDGAVGLGELLESGVRGTAGDVDGVATTGARRAEVMVWNYHDVVGPAAPAPLRVEVAGVPAGVSRVLVQEYRIDETHSNAYTVWQAMGSPQSPDAEQMRKLKAAGKLELAGAPQWLDVRAGGVEYGLELERDGISLLEMSW